MPPLFPAIKKKKKNLRSIFFFKKWQSQLEKKEKEKKELQKKNYKTKLHKFFPIVFQRQLQNLELET